MIPMIPICPQASCYHRLERHVQKVLRQGAKEARALPVDLAFGLWLTGGGKKPHIIEIWNVINGYQWDLTTNKITGLPVYPLFGFAAFNMGVYAQQNMYILEYIQAIV